MRRNRLDRALGRLRPRAGRDRLAVRGPAPMTPDHGPGHDRGLVRDPVAHTIGKK